MEVGYFAVGIGPVVDPEWLRTVATTAEGLGFSRHSFLPSLAL